MEQKYIDRAKKLWRERGYEQGAIKTIAELLEKIDLLESRADSYRWESNMKDWRR